MSAPRWIWPGTTVVRVVDGDTFDARVARDLGFYGEAAFRVRFRLQRINALLRIDDAEALTFADDLTQLVEQRQRGRRAAA